MRAATAVGLVAVVAVGVALAGPAVVNSGLLDPASPHATDAESDQRAVDACIHAITDGVRTCAVDPGWGDSDATAGITVESGTRPNTVLVTWPDGRTSELPTT